MLACVAGILHLESTTVHCAMVYMDRHQASTLETRGTRVALTALACLVIATKFGETCRDIDGVPVCPSTSHFVTALQEVCGNSTAVTGLTPRHLAAYELRALDVLRWRLRAATPITYARAYLHKGILCAGDGTDGAPLLPQEQQQACKYAEFLCDVCVCVCVCVWVCVCVTV